MVAQAGHLFPNGGARGAHVSSHHLTPEGPVSGAALARIKAGALCMCTPRGLKQTGCSDSNQVGGCLEVIGEEIVDVGHHLLGKLYHFLGFVGSGAVYYYAQQSTSIFTPWSRVGAWS